MSESKRNIPSNFKSEEEAFEYLVQQSQNKALKDQWKKELDQLPDAPEEKIELGKGSNIRRFIAVAASFLVLIGSFYWYNNQEGSLQQIAGVMIEETNFVLGSASFTRGTVENDDLSIELQKEINKSLEKADYDAAIGLFLTKERQSQLTIDDKFYYSLSLARIENGDYYKAIRLLDDVIKQKEKYYDESLWLQALLYLKINEPNNSKIILNKLINISNYQITNTKALLKKMAD